MPMRGAISVRLNGLFSDEFEVKVGVRQGSVLSPLLFVIVMEALSQEYRLGCPWELLYADDLVLMTESVEELKERLVLWKQKSRGKRVWESAWARQRYCAANMMCQKGVGRNSIFCHCCDHKSCSGIHPSNAKSVQEMSFLPYMILQK